MLNLTLIDAGVLLFVAFSIVRGRSRALGDSLHALIALLLLIGLFLGLRMGREVRELLGGVAEAMRAVPGLGSRLLIILAAWYLMRLLRRHSGHWLERAIPADWHRRVTPVSEGLRAVLLAGFVLWLVEGWFDGPPQAVPWSVQGVRAGDAWIAAQWRDPPAVTAPPAPHGPPRPWPPALPERR